MVNSIKFFAFSSKSFNNEKGERCKGCEKSEESAKRRYDKKV